MEPWDFEILYPIRRYDEAVIPMRMEDLHCLICCKYDRDLSPFQIYMAFKSSRDWFEWKKLITPDDNDEIRAFEHHIRSSGNYIYGEGQTITYYETIYVRPESVDHIDSNPPLSAVVFFKEDYLVRNVDAWPDDTSVAQIATEYQLWEKYNGKRAQGRN